MNASAAPPPAQSRGGASLLQAAIIASHTTDEGCCIMCADCGHVFAESVPLSDESQPVPNTILARQLYYHICALGRTAPSIWNRHGH